MSEKMYACLLRLYPSAFGEKYKAEALQLYRDLLRDETGMFRRWRLCCDLFTDALIGLPQAWRNSYAAASAPSLGSTAHDLPSFQLLDKQPLRPASILLASTLAFAALSAFGLVITLPVPFRSASRSKQTSIESVMARLNQAASPQAMSPQSDDPSSDGKAPAATGGQTASAAGARTASASNAAVVSVDPGAGIDNTERDRVIRAVASTLAAHYVDPQKGHDASELVLTREKSGAYAAIGDAHTLAERLTQDIQSSTRDSHLVVRYSTNAMPNSPPVPSAAQREAYRAAMIEQNCTIENVQVLPHHIGYIKFNFFPDPTVCSPIFRRSMEQLNQSSAIIFDLRDNTGGMPDMVADLAAQLFDRPVVWYNPRATPSAGTLSPAPGSKLANKPVYILTSRRTFSGAEHFTYDLQMLKRATVVGEPTRGGHVGDVYRIDNHFWMAVPTIRKPTPYGKLDWEGTGVVPDVNVNAADALAAAEKLALEPHPLEPRQR